MNKLDRDGLDPLQLIDEVSETLNLRVCPLNWPIGMGRSFKGVVDLQTKMVSLYTPEKHGTQILTEELNSSMSAAQFSVTILSTRLRKSLSCSRLQVTPLRKRTSSRAAPTQYFGAPQ